MYSVRYWKYQEAARVKGERNFPLESGRLMAEACEQARANTWLIDADRTQSITQVLNHRW